MLIASAEEFHRHFLKASNGQEVCGKEAMSLHKRHANEGQNKLQPIPADQLLAKQPKIGVGIGK